MPFLSDGGACPFLSSICKRRYIFHLIVVLTVLQWSVISCFIVLNKEDGAFIAVSISQYRSLCITEPSPNKAVGIYFDLVLVSSSSCVAGVVQGWHVVVLHSPSKRRLFSIISCCAAPKGALSASLVFSISATVVTSLSP